MGLKNIIKYSDRDSLFKSGISNRGAPLKQSMRSTSFDLFYGNGRVR
jgi:hypothetical protein